MHTNRGPAHFLLQPQSGYVGLIWSKIKMASLVYDIGPLLLFLIFSRENQFEELTSLGLGLGDVKNQSELFNEPNQQSHSLIRLNIL